MPDGNPFPSIINANQQFWTAGGRTPSPAYTPSKEKALASECTRTPSLREDFLPEEANDAFILMRNSTTTSEK